MLVRRLRVRDFRTYAAADVRLGPGLTVAHGRNGAGKTNLLEALYFGCTARSCRTSNEREVLRFGAETCRVEVSTRDDSGYEHELFVGFQPGQDKRLRVDGAPVERLLDAPGRPLVSVFLPERLELVKGPPALRRSHLDALVTGLWPARAQTRRQYSAALGQRNALLARLRQGASRASMAAWDLELARHGIALRDDRARAVALIADRFALVAGELGLDGEAVLRYKPRSSAATPEELAAELAERLDSDVERGFTQHGPHRDDLALQRDGRELRVYGSQGEQRLGLLALLLAEREALAEERGAPPLLLLDDVMSELDADRRALLVTRVAAVGQCLVTTTDLAHVPGGDGPGVTRLTVARGEVVQEGGPTDALGTSGPAEVAEVAGPVEAGGPTGAAEVVR